MTPQVKLKVTDGFFGCFQLNDHNTLVAPIINLGANEALIAIPKKDLNGLKAGDRVLFVQIVGATHISFCNRISAKIRWIKDLKSAKYLAAACNFCELTDTVRDQLVGFIETERCTRGQYC